MEKNLEFWNKYKEVPANALKSFDNGRFKGTDINTMWRMKVLTETYGKCGFGWYFKPIRLWTETTTEGEIFAFAEIELFIKENGEWSMPISGTGGNKLLRNTKSGTSSSDEAYKMAVTDAIGVACRNLGIGADVYWENDKTKYTEEIKETKQKTIVKESSFLKMAKDLIAEKDYQNLFNYYKVNSWEEFTETQLKDIIKKKGGKV
ncbi:MAG: hypothetical protein GX638_15155 [Crenarchaeota archaeon]|nr:hypothetical protein [Thermoproteota archaeon]